MKDDLEKLVRELDGVKGFYFRLDKSEEVLKRVCECKHADMPSWDVQVTVRSTNLMH